MIISVNVQLLLRNVNKLNHVIKLQCVPAAFLVISMKIK